MTVSRVSRSKLEYLVYALSPNLDSSLTERPSGVSSTEPRELNGLTGSKQALSLFFFFHYDFPWCFLFDFRGGYLELK